jgi:hypothetical protein
VAIRLTGHARTVCGERVIELAWVESVLNSPETTEPDALRPGHYLAFGRIAERGGRVLRVVYTDRDGDRWVVTAFFDRKRGRAARRAP